MSETVDDLIGRRIEAAQAGAADAFNGQLEALHRALCAYLAGTGFPWYERDGKVTVVLSEDTRVSAEFSPRYAGYLAVTYGQGRAEFTRELPPAGALVAFIGGLLADWEAGR